MIPNAAAAIVALLLTAAPLAAQPRWEPTARGIERLTAASMLLTPEGVLLVASGAGLHFTTDRGATWTRATIGTRESVVKQLLRLPTGVLVARQPDHVLRSTDVGRTWQVVASPPPSRYGRLQWGEIVQVDSALFVWQFDDRHDARLYRSDDGAASWQPIGGPTFGVRTVSMDMMAGLDGRLYLRDGPDREHRFGLDPRRERIEAIEQSPAHLSSAWSSLMRSRSGGVYAVLDELDTVDGVVVRPRQLPMRSTDDGATWSPIDTVSTRAIVDGPPGAVWLLQPTTTGDWRLARYDEATGRIDRVTDVGVSSLVTLDDGTLVGTRWPEGMVRSRDGIAWEPINEGLIEGRVSAIRFARDGSAIAALDGDIVRSSDDGRTWQRVVDDRYTVNGIEKLPSGTLVATWSAGLDSIWMRTSTDDGRTWTMARDPLSGALSAPLATRGGVRYGDFLLPSSSGEPRSTLMRSDDGGTTWSPTTLVAPVSALVEAPDGSILVGSVHENSPHGPSRIHRSSDDGRSWSVVLEPPGDGDHDVVGASLVIDRQGRIFTCGGDFVHRSSDNGRTWSRVRIVDPLNRGRISHTRELTVDSLGNVLVVEDWGGIRRSTDGGETWHRLDAGIDVDGVTALATSPTGRVFAGTFWRGLYMLAPERRE